MDLYPTTLESLLDFRKDVALGVEVHVFGGRGRGFFAEVDEMNFAVGVAQKKEAASA